MQVLREHQGWDAAPYQWATAGYWGAIQTGKTICGTLFGGTLFLGYLYGMNAAQAPAVHGARRDHACESVSRLFRGFLDRFGETDCQTLTGCNWSKDEEIQRYFKEEVYKDTCHRYLEYVLAHCVEQISNVPHFH